MCLLNHILDKTAKLQLHVSGVASMGLIAQNRCRRSPQPGLQLLFCIKNLSRGASQDCPLQEMLNFQPLGPVDVRRMTGYRHCLRRNPTAFPYCSNCLQNCLSPSSFQFIVWPCRLPYDLSMQLNLEALLFLFFFPD